MDELKKLLGDDLFNQVIEKIGADKVLFPHNKDQKVLIDDGTRIPKSRLDEVIDQKKQLQDQLEQRDKDLKTLKKAAAGNEDLLTKISDLEKTNKDTTAAFALQEKNLNKKFALKEALMNAGAQDPEARDMLVTKFDIEKLELDDAGKVKGFDDLLKPIKENKTLATLFTTTQLKGRTPGQGDEDLPEFTREQVEGMTQAEVDANYDKIQESMTKWQ